jgi:hypothetical protein
VIMSQFDGRCSAGDCVEEVRMDANSSARTIDCRAESLIFNLMNTKQGCCSVTCRMTRYDRNYKLTQK